MEKDTQCLVNGIVDSSCEIIKDYVNMIENDNNTSDNSLDKSTNFLEFVSIYVDLERSSFH